MEAMSSSDKKAKRLSRVFHGLKSKLRRDSARDSDRLADDAGSSKRNSLAGSAVLPRKIEEHIAVHIVQGDFTSPLATQNDPSEPEYLAEGPSAPPEYYLRQKTSQASGHETLASQSLDLGTKAGNYEAPSYAQPDLRWKEDTGVHSPSAEVNATKAGGDSTVSEPGESQTSVSQKPSKNIKEESQGAGPQKEEDIPKPKDPNDSNDQAPGAPTHTDSSGRTSYYSPVKSNYTTPGYEYASSSSGYDWESRKDLYGYDNPTMGEAYRRQLRMRELHLASVHETAQKMKEDAIQTTERRIKLGYAYHS